MRTGVGNSSGSSSSIFIAVLIGGVAGEVGRVVDIVGRAVNKVDGGFACGVTDKALNWFIVGIKES
jgi:hypothetical protein